MAGTTLTQMIDRQTEILKQVQAQASAARKTRIATGEDLIRGKQQMLQALQDRLQRKQDAREAARKQLDIEISGLEAKTKSLETEIKRDREQIAQAAKRGRKKGDVGGGKSIATLTGIKGIGKVAQGRLREHGINDVVGVARARPAELAEILGISEKRARDVIAAAKKQ